ncbi:DNA primase large subunit [Ilyodon furcidens]|uniref:DNA primase large subunit n=1 Tax=Ilyodon furcidens TaxID=33524 RepID=A0ABV0T6N4_9TELE
MAWDSISLTGKNKCGVKLYLPRYQRLPPQSGVYQRLSPEFGVTNTTTLADFPLYLAGLNIQWRLLPRLLGTMQFPSRKNLVSNSMTVLYAQPPQFYGHPPLENISLSEFESFAVDRLKLLKTVENLGVSNVKYSEQYSTKLEHELKTLNFPYKTEVAEPEKQRKDHISHFILRLAYCQTEDLRRWFIQQEVDLFRYRFNKLDCKNKLEFLHNNNLQYNTISVEEKNHLKEKLLNSSHGISGVILVEQDIYKVPFQDALDLVRTRKVYLKEGYAYIPHNDIVTIVLNDFRTRLSKALALTARSLPAVHSDERLQPLLNHLSHSYLGQDYSVQKNVGKISLEQIDSLAGKSFPLCMRQLHQALRDNHHLRHGGRMQYGLFLKGIGLSLEQALQFWRMEFIRGKVDADKSTQKTCVRQRSTFQQDKNYNKMV